MKAIPINIEGIQFRSKLEARWYLFMKNLGWNIEYEPEIEGIIGWIPDFLILGSGTFGTNKVLVEVKPFQTFSDFEGDYASQTIKKIENSLKNTLKQYDAVLLVGSSLNLGKAECGDGHTFVGGKIIRNYNVKEEPNIKFYNENFAYTDRPGGKFKVGVCDENVWFHDVINNDHDGGYGLDKDNYDFIYRCWNESGTQLQWKKITPYDNSIGNENYRKYKKLDLYKQNQIMDEYSYQEMCARQDSKDWWLNEYSSEYNGSFCKWLSVKSDLFKNFSKNYNNEVE